VLEHLAEQLARREPLTDTQVMLAVDELVKETVAPGVKAAFLSALSIKGETPEEIASFAGELRTRAVPVPLDAAWRESREILDVCGTGGDRLDTFNISTTVALVAASAGVAVAKHGNRAITSNCGSADVLEALGVPVELPPDEAARALRERHFAFFFAPRYHPAFKHIAPARKLCAGRGQRTIFNFLGPLLNPAGPTAQLLGVPRPGLCEPIARVLQSLGLRRGMVVSGSVQSPGATDSASASLDELSTLGPNTVAEFHHDRGFSVSTLDPGNFPLQPAALADLAGGDRQANADIVRRLLSGAERGPKRDAVLLNAAAALFIASRAKSLVEGWELAAGLLDSGAARAKLEELRTRP